jgi:hypothetical protein
MKKLSEAVRGKFYICEMYKRVKLFAFAGLLALLSNLCCSALVHVLKNQSTFIELTEEDSSEEEENSSGSKRGISFLEEEMHLSQPMSSFEEGNLQASKSLDFELDRHGFCKTKHAKRLENPPEFC